MCDLCDGIYNSSDGGGGGGSFSPDWTVISNDFTLNTTDFDFSRFFALYSEKLKLVNLFVNGQFRTDVTTASTVSKKLLDLPSYLTYESYVFSPGIGYDFSNGVNRGKLVIANFPNPMQYSPTRFASTNELYVGAFAWDNLSIRYFTAAAMINVTKV